jgi:hypothetical protein
MLVMEKSGMAGGYEKNSIKLTHIKANAEIQIV